MSDKKVALAERKHTRISNRPTSYSGADFNIWAYFPIVGEDLISKAHESLLNTEFIPPGSDPSYFNAVFDELRSADQAKALAKEAMTLRELSSHISLTNVQTITTSYASSLSAVEECGSSMPIDHTRGQKTFAGTIVFTVFDREPLAKLLEQGLGENFPGVDASSEYISFDQMMPFNIVIQADSELPYARGLPQSMMKIIVGVRFMTGGEAITVDDFFLEQQHQYVGRYISPWLKLSPSVKDEELENRLTKLLGSPRSKNDS